MTKMFTLYYREAIESLMESGMSEPAADALLTNLIGEANASIEALEPELHSIPPVHLSDWEYDLSQEIVHHLTKSGMSSNHALLLVATFMAAVEENVLTLC